MLLLSKHMRLRWLLVLLRSLKFHRHRSVWRPPNQHHHHGGVQCSGRSVWVLFSASFMNCGQPVLCNEVMLPVFISCNVESLRRWHCDGVSIETWPAVSPMTSTFITHVVTSTQNTGVKSPPGPPVRQVNHVECPVIPRQGGEGSEWACNSSAE